MQGTNSQSRARVVPVAVVAGLGMVGMGLVTDRVAMADVTSVTDTLMIEVEETCTFKNTSNETYTGSALNGSEVENFEDGGVHTFYLFCNNNGGYTVSATPYDLEATNTDDVIAYTSQYSPSGTNGMWTAKITSSEPGITVTSPVPVGGGVIISSNTSSSVSTSFTATYSAYVGTRTSAGTYSGQIEYVLSSLNGTVNSGENGSGNETGDDNGDSNNGGDNAGGTDTGNEIADNTGDNEGSGDSGSDNSGSGNTSQDNSGSSDTPNITPISPNNIYNTYSTTNTYNTTNYAGGGGSSIPVAAGTQLATSGNTGGATSENGSSATSSNSGNSGTSNSYEKPLGVTTNTTSTKEDSGTDPAPMIAAGVALAAAGVAVVALAQSKKKEEE